MQMKLHVVLAGEKVSLFYILVVRVTGLQKCRSFPWKNMSCFVVNWPRFKIGFKNNRCNGDAPFG